MDVFGGTAPSPTLEVSPNPFEHTVNIQIPKGLKNSKLTIYDQLGRAIRQLPVLEEDIPQTLSVDVADLDSGIYFLSLVSSGRKVMTQKIIKQGLY